MDVQMYRLGRLPTQLVDDHAKTNPDKVFVYIPRSLRLEDGCKSVTYKQLANAINHVAHIISKRKPHALERTSPVSSDSPSRPRDVPIFAYVGPGDSRYTVMTLACVKSGCQAFFLSPRSSNEAAARLLKQTNCRNFWYADGFGDMVTEWVGGRDMTVSCVGSEDDWLLAPDSPSFPYNRTPEEAQWDPLVVLHTSGTTDFPKPRFLRLGQIMRADVMMDLPELNGQQSIVQSTAAEAGRFFNSLPQFHNGGFMTMHLYALMAGKPVTLPVPGQPPTPEALTHAIQASGADCAVLVPAFIEGMRKTDTGLKTLLDLKYLVTAGGRLAQATGDQLMAKGLRIINFISSTEFAPWACYCPLEPKDWQWFHLDSHLMGAVWRPASDEPDVFELVFCRKKHIRGPVDQGIFYTFPDEEEVSTNDLFRRHPTKPDHWDYVGRSDDIITFSTGLKLNSSAVEDRLMSSPNVKSALVVGSMRPQPGLIIEPTVLMSNETDKKQLVDSVWPAIQEINDKGFSHSRIARKLVRVADPDIPFLRADKGTVQRKRTLDAYKSFIDAMYDELGREDVSDLLRLQPAPHKPRDEKSVDINVKR